MSLRRHFVVLGLHGDRSPTLHSYSQAEFRRIMNTARTGARRTAEEIRTHRQLLGRWRTGQAEPDPRTLGLLRILDHDERTGDVPRDRRGNAVQSMARHGRV